MYDGRCTSIRSQIAFTVPAIVIGANGTPKTQTRSAPGGDPDDSPFSSDRATIT